jgi:hypothetical protein
MNTDILYIDKDRPEIEFSVRILSESDHVVRFVTFGNAELELTKDEFESHFTPAVREDLRYELRMPS